jgi:TolB-like protein/tetratricopeptide (TPR) repeat protein
MRSLIRNVRSSRYARVTIAYAATAFILLQLADLLFDDLRLPAFSKLLLVAFLALGLPIALATTWALEPGSIKKPPGKPVIEGAGQLTSLAVLPFADLSPDHDRKYLSDGIAEELLSSLARVPGLRVPARTSSFSAHAAGGDARQIGETLSVEAILEGSLRSDGNKLRISAQLVEVESGFQVWAQTFQTEMTNIFEVQETITKGILDALKLRLPDEPDPRARAPHPAAHEAFLKGRHCWHRGSQGALEQAVLFFEEAVAADPTYAEAYAGLADALVSLGNQTYLDPKTAYPRARAAAQKALQLNGQLADAHAALGSIAFVHDWDFAEAERNLRQAVELGPGSVTAHHHFARYLCAAGRDAEALDQAQTALVLDPLSVASNVFLAVVHRSAGRHDEGIEQLEQARALFPQEFRVFYSLSFSLAYAGRTREAVDAAEKAAAIAGRSVFALGALGYAKARAGENDEANAILSELTAAAAQQYVCPYDIGLIHAGLGDVDEAFDWLERAFAVRDHALLFIKVDAGLDTLRLDPRFERLEQKVWPE